MIGARYIENNTWACVDMEFLFEFLIRQLTTEKVPTNCLVLRIMKVLPFIHQPDRVAPKASDVSAADWRYQTHLKTCGFSQGWKSLYNTVVYMINTLMRQSDQCEIHTQMRRSDWCEQHTTPHANRILLVFYFLSKKITKKLSRPFESLSERHFLNRDTNNSR